MKNYFRNALENSRTLDLEWTHDCAILSSGFDTKVCKIL